MDTEDGWITGWMANLMVILYERFYIFWAKVQFVFLVTGIGSKASKNIGNKNSKKQAVLPFKNIKWWTLLHIKVIKTTIVCYQFCGLCQEKFFNSSIFIVYHIYTLLSHSYFFYFSSPQYFLVSVHSKWQFSCWLYRIYLKI